MMMLFSARQRVRGAMLIEVLMTVVLVAIVGLGIIAGITFGSYSQQKVHERNGATRAAADALEKVKRTSYYNLAPVSETVTIFDSNTPTEPADDSTATLNVRFYTTDGTDVSNNIPTDNPTLLLVEATVNWAPASRKAKTETITMSTLITP